jgi:predicted secreted protein
MGWATGIAVYLVIWWISLFGVLPWRSEAASDPQPGTIESAPDNPHLKIKFAITTVIATVLWLGLYALVKSDIISFHEMAKGLAGPGD